MQGAHGVPRLRTPRRQVEEPVLGRAGEKGYGLEATPHREGERGSPAPHSTTEASQGGGAPGLRPKTGCPPGTAPGSRGTQS